MSGPGVVSLVGAGPGDPGLITRRGLELLREADVVVHDRLVGRELLEEASPHATLIDVGKSPGRPGVGQQGINDLLVEHARRGLHVVRLKGGDPFVFGRGWEELRACRRVGIPCEVVAGVTSVIGAPTNAELPVTARGVARSFAVVTARAEAGAEYDLDFESLSGLDTVCVLMGRRRLGEICRGFVRAGRPERTPVALVERGTMAGERVVPGTLATIETIAAEAEVAAPVVIVIGATAGLDDEIGVAGTLAGQRVVVTRPRSAARPLVRALRARGASVIEAPTIRITYRESVRLDRRPADYDWIVFTSKHGVEGFFRTLEAEGLDTRAVGAARIAVVGPATARTLRRRGIHADLMPDHYRAEALTATLAENDAMRGASVLFPCGTRALAEVPRELSAAGATVDRLVVYDTVPRPFDPAVARTLARGFDVLLLHSPTGVRAFADSGVAVDATTIVGCIGPTTAAAARAVGWPVDIVPSIHTDDGLVEDLESLLARDRATEAVP